jgi:transposase
VNRVQGVLERANITRASVATDLMGVSGRAILAAWREGPAEAAMMAELAKGRLRTTIPLREPALTGLRRDHQRRLLALPWAHIDVLDEPMALLNAAITRGGMTLGPREPPTPPAPGEETDGTMSAPDTVTSPWPCARAVSGLDTSPGVDQRGAERLVADWGTDRGRFGPAARLAAWTGVAPGHDARAGTRRSGQPRQGHRAWRTGMTPRAQAAARRKGP